MKPILKWAGGKNGLLKKIKEYLPSDLHQHNYHEPFVGGGAVFFHLEPKRGTINDVNERLINLYKVVRDDPLALIYEAKKLQAFVKDKKKYYELRDTFNSKINKVKSCARVYGSSTYPSFFEFPATKNGKIVDIPVACGSKGSVSNVDRSYLILS